MAHMKFGQPLKNPSLAFELDSIAGRLLDTWTRIDVIVDVFPIKHGDIVASYGIMVVLPKGYSTSSPLRLPKFVQ